MHRLVHIQADGPTVYLNVYQAKLPSLPSPIAEEFEEASRKVLSSHGDEPAKIKSMNRTAVFSRRLVLEGGDKVRVQ